MDSMISEVYSRRGDFYYLIHRDLLYLGIEMTDSQKKNIHKVPVESNDNL